jgi:hypothetical protein
MLWVNSSRSLEMLAQWSAARSLMRVGDVRGRSYFMSSSQRAAERSEGNPFVAMEVLHDLGLALPHAVETANRFVGLHVLGVTGIQRTRATFAAPSMSVAISDARYSAVWIVSRPSIVQCASEFTLPGMSHSTTPQPLRDRGEARTHRSHRSRLIARPVARSLRIISPLP